MQNVPLRQSTASQEIPLGPFLDSTNGNDQETALSIANADIKLWKAGATTEVSKNSGGATHIANGRYYAVLDATDTDTIGPLRVACHPTGALAVETGCTVYPAVVFDSLFSANGPRPIFGVIDDGTAQAVGASSITLRSGFSATNDVMIGALIWVWSATNGLHERAVVRDWDNSTKVATIDGWIAQQPTGTVLYSVAPAVGMSASDLKGFFTLNSGSTYANAVAGSVVYEIAKNAGRYRRAMAVAKFKFYMELTAGGPATGATVTAQLSKDGGAFTTVAGAVTEMANGWYWHALTGTEMTADEIALKYTATSCRQTNIKVPLV